MILFFLADCSPPSLALKLTAIVVILIIVFINSTSVKLSTGFLNVFSIGKIISLIVIIFGGIIMLTKGNFNHLNILKIYNSNKI